MKKLVARAVNLIKEEDGVTAIEYGLIAGLIAVALITAVGYVTGGLDNIFSDIGTKLTSLMPSS